MRDRLTEAIEDEASIASVAPPKTVLLRLCAWCGAELAPIDGKGQTGTSHGMCAACAADFVTEGCR